METAKQRGNLDPNAAPDKYIVMLDGACMQPVMKDGAAVMVDKNAPCEGGDLVVIYYKPEHVRPGDAHASLKRLVLAVPPYVKWPWKEHPQSEVHAMIVFEMLNPPQQFQAKAADLLAVHKVIGQVPADVKFDPSKKSFCFPAGHPALGSNP